MDENSAKSYRRRVRIEKAPDRPYMQVSKEFGRFLSFYGMDKRVDEVMECGTHVRVKPCAGDVPHPFGYAWYCMNRGICPVCDEIETFVQVSDRMVFLAKLFNHARQRFHVWFVDFTVGKDIRENIPRDGLSRFGGVAYATMREYFAQKLKMKVRFGMEVSPQYWHSNAPGLEYLPHFHIMIPRLFVEESTGRILDRLKMELLDEEVIKVIWRKNVEAITGPSESTFRDLSKDKFSVKLGFTRRMFPMRHRLKYMYRGAVFDIEKYVNAGRDYYGWDREFVVWLLTTKHKRHVGYGLFSARNLSAESQFMRSIGLDYQTRMERERERRKKFCPHCGAIVESGHVEVSVNFKEAHLRGYEMLKANYEDELKREADGRYVPY